MSIAAKPLERKLALVTGSSRVIGAAAEGASVIVNYAASPARAEAVVDEIKKAGGHPEARALKDDLGQPPGHVIEQTPAAQVATVASASSKAEFTPPKKIPVGTEADGATAVKRAEAKG